MIALRDSQSMELFYYEIKFGKSRDLLEGCKEMHSLNNNIEKIIREKTQRFQPLKGCH